MPKAVRLSRPAHPASRKLPRLNKGERPLRVLDHELLDVRLGHALCSEVRQEFFQL